MKTETLTEQEIERVFQGTNYGVAPNYKVIIIDTLLKLVVGFRTGSTSIAVCNELGLLKTNKKPNAKGLAFMRENYKLIGKERN